VTEQIGPETTVDEVLTRLPGAATVFLDRRMHCVGCDLARFETLAEAARVYRQPTVELVAALRCLAPGAPKDPGDGE
jgi:hybrid cluster-associated redox disulfide protein